MNCCAPDPSLLETIIHLAFPRKGWYTGAVLGMNFMDTIDVAIGLDMSGSIGDQRQKTFR